MTRKKKRGGAAAAAEYENWLKSPRVACHVIPGTDPPALIDTFKRVPLRHDFTFFLSHFHADHYGGLSSSWTRGLIHCSRVTGRMLSRSLGVRPSYVNQLELDKEYTIGGASVTLVDANHCPGAAMLLFRTRDGCVYLHTGDFRFDPQMLQRQILTQQKVDILFLDTTYANPDYTFVSQSESLRQAVEISRKTVAVKSSERTLFLVGAYATGKEKVAFALAEANNWKIYANGRRRCILDCQDLSEKRRALITSNPTEANIHLVPMGTIGTVLPYFRANFTKIDSYLKEHRINDIFTSVVGLLPTGWSLTTKWNKEHAVMVSGYASVYLLEYSEHSSYLELRAFVLGLKPALVIPTVFTGNKNYESLLEEWQPAKLAAQVELENAQQQKTKRKRNGDVKEEDRSQSRLTAFFRQKSSVGIFVSNQPLKQEPPETKVLSASRRCSSEGCTKRGRGTTALAPEAVSTAVRSSSAGSKDVPQNITAAEGGGRVEEERATLASVAAAPAAGGVAAGGPVAVATFKTEVCEVKHAAEVKSETAAAAAAILPCTLHENNDERDSGRTFLKREVTDSAVVCAAVGLGLENKKQEEDSESLKKEQIHATVSNSSSSGSESCSSSSTGSSSATRRSGSVTEVSESSSITAYASSNGTACSVKNLADAVVTESGVVRSSRRSSVSSVATLSVGSPSTAGKSTGKNKRGTARAPRASKGTKAPETNVRTLPLSWFQKRNPPTPTTTSVGTDSSTDKGNENCRSAPQRTLGAASVSADAAQVAENRQEARQGLPTVNEIIEISDDC